MIVKFKKLFEQALIPKYDCIGDAGLTMTAISRKFDTNRHIEYGTGIAVEIPEGYVGLLFSRSSICTKALSMSNCVGVIDSGYRGEIKFKFTWLDCIYGDTYQIGDKIGQLIIIPYPQIELEECEELSKTERGDQGFGSTGK